MYVVLVEFTARPGHEDDFRRRVRQQAADSLKNEDGCHVFDVCADPERADRIVLYEVYTDSAAFDAHVASDHFKDFDGAVRPWVADKSVRILERLPAG